MNKISGIIPANARTRSVDVTTAQPVRPGAPTWGRPVGKVTQASSLDVADRVDLRNGQQATTADKAIQADTQSYKKAVESARAKVVDDLAKKFFETNPKAEVRENDLTKSEETLKSIEDSEPIVDRSKPAVAPTPDLRLASSEREE